MAGVAYDELQNAYSEGKQIYHHIKVAKAVSVLVRGTRCYISSSNKSSISLFYHPSGHEKKWTPGDAVPLGALQHGLTHPQSLSPKNAGHCRGANCGEPLACLLFTLFNPEGDLREARIVAWGIWDGKEGVMPPCGGSDWMLFEFETDNSHG